MSTKVSTDLIDLSSNTGGLIWAKGTTAQQPASATAGEMRVDTTTNTTLVYNGTQWKTLKETAFVVPPVPTRFLVVAGGGSGGRGWPGGGGAGGLRTSYGSNSGGGGSAESTTDISLNTAYTITVGDGGAASTGLGNNGSNSIFSTITSVGGGGGGSNAVSPYGAKDGGSGGGGSESSTDATGGSGTAGQGYSGGNGLNGSVTTASGAGGGGAGAAAGNSSSGYASGGGIGLNVGITGTGTFYAGGGAGYGNGPASGGNGGGASSSGTAGGFPGTLNTGGGGSGTYRDSTSASGAGGSGVVILRYPTADLPYFTTTGTLNTPSATDTVADAAYPVTNTAYYKLDSNANDSGLGSGYIGQGGIFNGTSSVISLPTGVDKNNNFTLSFWVNFDTLSDYDSLITLQLNYRIYTNAMSDGRLFFYDGNTTLSTSAGAVATGNWYNIVVTKSSTLVNGKGMIIYVNGVDVANNSVTANAINNTSTGLNLLGAYNASPGGNYFYLDGRLDQVRIYNTALSSSNVALLYAETSATSSTLNYPTGTGGQALYEFSGNADSTSSSAYNGTATDVLYAYNGTATDVTYGNGRFNEAANFNGSSSKISIPGSFGIGNIASYSVSLWAKSNSNTSQVWIGGKTTRILNNHNFTIGQYNASNQTRVFCGSDANTWLLSQTSSVFYDGLWHNYTFVKNGTNGYFYIDGVLFDSSNVFDSSTTLDPSGDEYIAAQWNGAPSFNGSIDQVRIFSSALAAGDVEDLYNEHFPTKFTDGSDTALKFTGGTGDITFADTAPVFTPGDNFNSVLYTGNNGTQSITGVGFQPDFTWIKARDNGSNNHALTDSVRGTGSGNGLSSNTTGAEGQYSAAYGYLSAFGTDGFTVQAGSTSPNFVNSSSANYVAWNWKAGGAARNNTDGSVASLVSANTAAGFSIVKYTGNSTVGATIGHGLGVKPELFFIKGLSGIRDWIAWCNEDNTKLGYLNYTDAFDSSRYSWALNSTQPTSTTITFSNDAATNGSGNYIAYCWRSIAGYSKIGSYTGNGSTTGPTIVTGFEPAWVMVKRTDNTSAWNIQDNKRNTTNPRTSVLQASSSDQEYTSSTYAINFNTNDFQIVNSDNGWNTSGGTYIYMAFATNPT